MPDYDVSQLNSAPDYNAMAQGSQMTPTVADNSYAAAYTAGSDRGVASTVATTVLGAGIDLADTIGSSILPGVQRGDINNKFLNAVGSPGMTKFFNDNKGAIEVGSGIAGTVLADVAARKFLAPASIAMKALQGLPFVGKIAALDEDYQSAVRLVNLTTAESARRGLVGSERFLGTELSFSALGSQALVTTPKAAYWNLRAATSAKSLTHTFVMEGIMAAGLHTNTMLYDNSLAHNVAWNLAFAAGIGGIVDSAITSYTMRKIANSDVVRRLNSAAYDISGKESDRLIAPEIAQAIAEKTQGTPDSMGWMYAGRGAITDRITSLATSASELQKTPDTLTSRTLALFSKRESIANPVMGQAQEELQKVTVKGLRGVSKAGFSIDAPEYGAPLKESLVRDPTSMYGIEEIGAALPEIGLEGTINLRNQTLLERTNKVNSLLSMDGTMKTTKVKLDDGSLVPMDSFVPLKPEERDALIAERKELWYANSSKPAIMYQPGQWAPAGLAPMLEGYQPRKIARETIGGGPGGLSIYQRERLPGEDPLGLSTDGDLYLPGNMTDVSRLNTADMLHLYQVGGTMTDDMRKFGSVFTVPDKPNWFHLDLAESLIKKTNDPTSVIWPEGMNRQTAAVEAFAQKVDAIKRNDMASRLGKAGPLSDVDTFTAQIKYNMPSLTSYQMGLMGQMETPVDMLVQGFKNGDQVRKMGYQQLVDGLNQARKIQGFTQDISNTLEDLQGNSFSFLRDRDGKPFQPLIGIRRPMSPMEWSQNELLSRQVGRAAFTKDMLTGETAHPATSQFVQAITSDPNFAEAGNVTQLADDQHRSMIPGATTSAPQTTVGAFTNAVATRERRDVDNLTMLSASRVRENSQRLIGAITRGMIADKLGDIVTQMKSPRSITSKLMVDQFISHRPGWELVKDAEQIALPEGSGWAFPLDHTSALNQQRFKQLYGRDLEKGQHLLNPQGQTVVVDDLAKDALTRVMALRSETLGMKNTVLRAQGLPEIAEAPWAVTPPQLKGKYVAHTFDMQNNVVPGMTAIADSPEQLTKAMADLQKSPQWQNGWNIRSRDQVTSFMDLWDKAQMDWVAPNVTAIQPGKSNFGITSGPTINRQAWEDMLTGSRDELLEHGNDVMSTLFKEQLKSAQTRSSIAQAQGAVGVKTNTQHSSIFDRYIQNLMGYSSLSAKDSFSGPVQDWAVNRINGFLNSDAVNSAADTYGALKDHLRTLLPYGQDATYQAKFDKVSKELGKYMPFATVNDFIESQTGSRPARDIADVTSKLSWFEATSRLRWFESMHAVANIGGIMSNMSSVMRALQPIGAETVEEAAKRNGSLAMTLATPEGTKFNVPNTPKLMWQSMKDAWSQLQDKELSDFTQRAVRLGYMHQEVAEFNRTWGAIDSKEGWRGFVFGNPAADKSTFGGKVAASGGIDKWLGIVSDKSEDFSRAWGMYAGRRVAEAIGIHGVDDQLAFAHDITNKLIANYDPRNRPEVMQGPLGAMAGLFQSYTINFYQRMLRYLETQNHQALAMQYATQGAVFGAQSLPGWSTLNQMFFDHGQANNDDPVNSIYHRFGTQVGDLVMHGMLSNLPMLLGQEGFSVYSRGDSQIRVPGIPVPQFLGGTGDVGSLPMIDTAKRLWNGVGTAVDLLVNHHQGLGLNTLAEVASNMITNRPLAGAIEMLGAHGADTSADGQLVSQAHGMLEGAYRFMGVKGMQQQIETEQFYANKVAMEDQASRQFDLRLTTRAAVRDGRYDDLPGIFADYVQNGGDGHHYTKWVTEATKAAMLTRGENELQKALKDPNNSKNAYIGRLLDAQVGVERDDNEDDYGAADAAAKQIQDRSIGQMGGDPTNPTMPGSPAQNSIFAPIQKAQQTPGMGMPDPSMLPPNTQTARAPGALQPPGMVPGLGQPAQPTQ